MQVAAGIVMLELSAAMMNGPGNLYPTLIWDENEVVLVDAGAKGGIIRELTLRRVVVSCVPYDVDVATVLSLHPDGVLVSNGPGDPAVLHQTIRLIRALLEHNQRHEHQLPQS